MKWQAGSRYTRTQLKERRKSFRSEWHKAFALWPVSVPERSHDSIVVPRLWVWLEPIEQRLYYGTWERRVWGGETKSLEQLVRRSP